MFTHERYRAIFKIIDEALWDIATARGKSGLAYSLEARADMLGIERKRAQRIIAAYIDAKAAMMEQIIFEDRFSEIPMPERPIHPEPQNADPSLLLSKLAASAILDELNLEKDQSAALADAMQARQEDCGPILLDAQTLRKVAEQAIRDSRASSQALYRETQKEEQRPSAECPQPSSEKNRTT